jgi:CheY-like chemotaxis protein/anti-sigma regulatory factor (Ser/Thr protein kinase)
MLGFTQLLLEDGAERLTGRDRSQLEHVHRAGWHLVSLVNDVLDVSRIESGSVDLRPRPVALIPLLDEALHLGGPMSGQFGIALRAAYRRLAPVGVEADPVRLRQVVINLLSNAIKYNRPGGTVQVEVHAAPEEVTIAVVDTGMGMTGEQLEHLYEPFNRLGRERGGIEGTGLGLSLTRQLVRQMGGELAIESLAGRGTTARVSLRRAAVPADGSPSPAAADDDETAPQPCGLVLYVEDNEINVMVVEQMLARWPDVRFVHAPDGRSGIEQAARCRPDLLLLDMQLPDMSGYEVLAALALREETRGLEAVVLSAGAMQEDIDKAFAAGARDYWTKPLELERFLADVARLLALRAPTPACATSRTRCG